MTNDACERWSEMFDRRGFAGPINLFDESEASLLAARLAKTPTPDTWLKGCPASSTDWFELAIRPDILDRVVAAIGDDVILCGGNLLFRAPGQVHPWHVDAHLADPAGRSISVWVGLENINLQSTLRVVPGSHLFGFSPEQRAAEHDRATADITDADVTEWAGAIEPRAGVLPVPMAAGDAVFIDGALWHGTVNGASSERVSLVLHYATPDKPVRMHTAATTWPFTVLEHPRPPCQVVRGSDHFRINRLVPAPTGGGRQLSTVFDTASSFDASSPKWKPDPLFVGSTRALPYLNIKTNVVDPELTDHDQHAHDREQITIAIEGRATMQFGGPDHPLEADLDPRMFAYVPSGTLHSMVNNERRPHRQIDVSWIGTGSGSPIPLGLTIASVDDRAADPEMLAERKRSAVELLSGPTATLDRLRVLRVDMSPGFVGADDTDAYDVVLMVLGGTVATLGRTATAGDVVFYSAGETHTIAVHGDDFVQLLVFEFHSMYTGNPVRSLRRAVTSRLPRPVRTAVRRARAVLARRR